MKWVSSSTWAREGWTCIHRQPFKRGYLSALQTAIGPIATYFHLKVREMGGDSVRVREWGLSSHSIVLISAFMLTLFTVHDFMYLVPLRVYPPGPRPFDYIILVLAVYFVLVALSRIGRTRTLTRVDRTVTLRGFLYGLPVGTVTADTRQCLVLLCRLHQAQAAPKVGYVKQDGYVVWVLLPDAAMPVCVTKDRAEAIRVAADVAKSFRCGCAHRLDHTMWASVAPYW